MFQAVSVIGDNLFKPPVVLEEPEPRPRCAPPSAGAKLALGVLKNMFGPQCDAEAAVSAGDADDIVGHGTQGPVVPAHVKVDLCTSAELDDSLTSDELSVKDAMASAVCAEGLAATDGEVLTVNRSIASIVAQAAMEVAASAPLPSLASPPSNVEAAGCPAAPAPDVQDSMGVDEAAEAAALPVSLDQPLLLPAAALVVPADVPVPVPLPPQLPAFQTLPHCGYIYNGITRTGRITEWGRSGGPLNSRSARCLELKFGSSHLVCFTSDHSLLSCSAVQYND